MDKITKSRCTSGGHFVDSNEIILDNRNGTSICRSCVHRLKIPHTYHGQYVDFGKRDALLDRPGKDLRGVHMRTQIKEKK